LRIFFPFIQAFAHACMRCDFFYAHPWRQNNVPLIDKAEMAIRQGEWNSYVDEYVACKDSPTPVCKQCREKNGTIIPTGVYTRGEPDC
jgi:hypothetical protein